jgi:DNA-binding transcriptional regulator YiaG
MVGKIEDAVRTTVARAVNRALRGSVAPLARDVRTLKRTVSALARSMSSLEKIAGEQMREKQQELSRLQAPEEQVKGARFSPRLIRALRMRLKLTQGEMAAMLGVSSASVFAWEAGKSTPRGANRAALVALRKLGRRDARRILADKAAAEKPAAPPAKRRRHE